VLHADFVPFQRNSGSEFFSSGHACGSAINSLCILISTGKSKVKKCAIYPKGKGRNTLTKCANKGGMQNVVISAAAALDPDAHVVAESTFGL